MEQDIENWKGGWGGGKVYENVLQLTPLIQFAQHIRMLASCDVN